jgi:hypothetical protein
MIDNYSFGSITIDGRTYDADVLVYPERIDNRWWRKEGHRLQLADLQGVLETNPSALVVGTGYFGRMYVDPAARHHPRCLRDEESLRRIQSIERDAEGCGCASSDLLTEPKLRDET